jgi:putative ABC transport system permease protein
MITTMFTITDQTARYVNHLREGWLNLYYFKLRSLLALLGVLVGTASVVAMVLSGDLAANEAIRQFKSLGTDLLAMSINTEDDKSQESAGKIDNLTLSQALHLAKADEGIFQVAPYTQVFHPISYNGNGMQGMVLGVTNHFANLVDIKLKEGRFISFLDKQEFYCVIGEGIYNQMKNITFKDPLGQQLQIGKYIFIVIGVANAWQENSFVYANIDQSIFVPLMASRLISPYATINNIIIKLTTNADIARVEERLTTSVNAISSAKKLSFRSAKELITKMENQSNILNVFLGLIGGISLVVGGIGVMNIMLVSVMERRREIGIRLAVGAKGRDISMLFLMEAIILSLTGGILGVVIGIIIAYAIALVWHWEFTLFLWPPLAGFSVSVAIGIFFGFYPAYLASKLNPVEALRSE